MDFFNCQFGRFVEFLHSIAGIGPSSVRVVWCCETAEFDHSNFY